MKNILKQSKKGQLNLGDAPGVVLISLFLFMIMGTAAFVLEQYQDAFPVNAAEVINETLSVVDNDGDTVVHSGDCNFQDFTIILMSNASGAEEIDINNYTFSPTGVITWNDSAVSDHYFEDDWNITYSFGSSGTACEVTTNLTAEVEDNVSIAGMVLTISLIGIVLSILIGLFFVFTGRRGI